MTDFVVVPPPLVAVHENVVPVVSAETVYDAQAGVVIGVSASVAVHATETLLVYQPFWPSVPVT